MRRDLEGSRRPAIDTYLDARLLTNRHKLLRNVLKPRRLPARHCRQRHPQLQDPHLAERFDVFVVYHAAPSRHPQHVAGLEYTLVAIACLTLDCKGRNFKSGMRVRAACTSAWRKINAVVRQ